MAGSFNGSSDYLVSLLSMLTVLEDTFTIAGWAKRGTTTQAYYTMWSGGQAAAAVRIANDDTIELTKSYTSVICKSTGTLTGLNWHHVAVSKNGSSVHMYIDGVEGTGTVTNATMTPNGARHVHLGADFSTDDTTGLALWFNGALAEWAAFSRVLNADEVASLAKGLTPRILGPTIYFPLIHEPVAGEVRDPFVGVGTGGSGTTFADHPPIFYGSAPLVGKFRGVAGPPAPPVFRPATLVRRDRRRGNGKAKPAPRLARQTKGLLTEQLFGSLSAWSNEGTWAVDSTRPTYIAHPSPIGALTAGAVGSNDGSGVREGHLIVRPPNPDGSSRWYLFYGAGDGNDSGANAPWKPQLAYSDDRGVTWTKVGIVALTGGGTPAARDMLYIFRHPDGQFRLHVLEADGANTGIPAQPYHDAIYKAGAPTGSFAFVREPISLGAAPDFDHWSVCGSWLENVGGTWHFYYSALGPDAVADELTVGHATGSDPDGPYTKDGLGSWTSAATTGPTVGVRPENPKNWWAPDLGKYVSVNNGTGSGQSEINTVHFSDTQTDFRGSSVYRVTIQWRDYPWDGDRSLAYLPGSVNHAVGLISPYCDEEGRALRDPISGHVPFTFDAEPPTNFNGSANTPGYHRGRKIRHGVLEPARYAAGYVAPDATRRNLFLPLSHGDFVAEFTVEFSGTHDFGFKYRLGSTTASDGGNGYYAQINLSNNQLNLYKITGGSYASLGSTAAMAWPSTYDSKNLTSMRVKVSVIGGRHQIFIASDVPTLDVNDSTYTTGVAIGLAAANNARFYNLRLRASDDVTIRGCPPGATVRLRGAGGVPFAIGTASSDGTAGLTNVHYPMHEIEVDGHPCAVPDGIYGGDTYQYVT